MNKVVIVSATNRANSYTYRVASNYASILSSLQMEPVMLDMRDLPREIVFTELFGNRTPAYDEYIRRFISPYSVFVFIVPEYNGSFPGILKVFLDSIHPREWAGKYACLVGVSDGRAGNLRGMEHLTGILQYLKMHVYHNKLPISVVAKVLDENGLFVEEQNRASLSQVEGFLQFAK